MRGGAAVAGSSTLLAVVVCFSYLGLGDAHPLCWYGPDRAVSFDAEATFCPDENAEGFCCEPDEEAPLEATYTAAAVSADCAALYKEVLCGVCNPYSAHLYTRLGTDDGLAMTEEFCESYFTACSADLGLPATYCDTHVDDGATTEYWSYPLNIAAAAGDDDVTSAFPDLPESSLPENPLSMQMSPDGTVWWIGGMEGIIKQVAVGNPSGSVDILDISGKLEFSYEQGLMGFAFAPSFTSTGLFYVSYVIPGIVEPENGINVLSKFVYTAGDTTATYNSEEIFIETSEKGSSVHSSGWVGFAPSSYEAPDEASHDLYWSVGDSGPQNDPFNRGQDPMEFHGSIIRISVPASLDATGYVSPAGNLFDGTDGLAEICAMGLRNPHRCGFDSMTDELYCGDVGQDSVEEVNIIECGSDYGWRVFEGSRCNDGYDESACATQSRSGVVFPTFQYCHFDYDSDSDTDEFTGGEDVCGGRAITGLSIVGGYVYRGSRFADVLEGHYVFADWSTGSLHHLAPLSGGGWEAGNILSSAPKTAGFAQDQDGELYLIGYQGNIYELPCGDLCTSTEAACMDQAETVPSYVELGCFGDGDDRTLTLSKAPTCDTMNAEMCARYCATIDGAVFFGLEYQRECFCGSASDDYTANGELPDSSCNMQCSGFSSEYCGSRYVLNIFEITSLDGSDAATSSSTTITETPAPMVVGTPTPSQSEVTTTPAPVVADSDDDGLPTPTAENYMGCFIDYKTGRVLDLAFTDSATMTESVCEAFCAEQGAIIYGVEYGRECFCGDETSDFELYGPTTGCDYPCTGDASVTCGGYDAIAVYAMVEDTGTSLTTLTADPLDEVTNDTITTTSYTGADEYVGCFLDIRDSRILSAAMTDSGNMTPAKCRAFCEGRGATLYGVEWGIECWCGDVDDFEAAAEPESECNYPCAGDPGMICGGHLSTSVYTVY